MRDIEADWLVSIWQSAIKHPGEWVRVCDSIYGATQTCIWRDQPDMYDDLTTLSGIAATHRFDSIVYREAA